MSENQLAQLEFITSGLRVDADETNTSSACNWFQSKDYYQQFCPGAQQLVIRVIDKELTSEELGGELAPNLKDQLEPYEASRIVYYNFPFKQTMNAGTLIDKEGSNLFHFWTQKETVDENGVKSIKFEKIAQYKKIRSLSISNIVYGGIFEELSFGIVIDDDWNVHLFSYNGSESDLDERAFKHEQKRNVVTQLTGGPFKDDSKDRTPRYDIDQELGQIALLYDNQDKDLKNIFKIFQINYDPDDKNFETPDIATANSLNLKEALDRDINSGEIPYSNFKRLDEYFVFYDSDKPVSQQVLILTNTE